MGDICPDVRLFIAEYHIFSILGICIPSLATLVLLAYPAVVGAVRAAADAHTLSYIIFDRSLRR